jgi:hypothetical protein
VNVSAIIVTRGNVDLKPVLNSLPWEWEIIVWDNSYGYVKRQPPGGRDWNTWTSIGRGPNAPDLSVYGRYAAIEYASHDLIYVQDDDVIVSDPQAIVVAWYEALEHPDNFNGENMVVANMPQEFRHDGYTDSCLVGFGACFHRDLPGKAFERFFAGNPARDMLAFNRCCDVVFTALTPRVLVDVTKENLPYATDASRMYRQPDHVGGRQRMLDLVRSLA